MAYPASQDIPAKALERANELMRELKRIAQNHSSRLASQGASSSEVRALKNTLTNYKSQLQTLASTPGIGAYAQDQHGNTGLDIAAEFQGVMDAIDGSVTEIKDKFPTHDGTLTGFLLAETWDGDRIFTVQQLDGLRVWMETLASSIN